MPVATTRDATTTSYSELLAELQSAKPAPGLRPFEVSLIGRWSEGRRRREFAHAAFPRRRSPAATPRSRSRTPTAAGSCCCARCAGPPLRDRQGRGLRHRRQRRLREPPALRDLARSRRVVGDRCRIDQRRARRARGRRARAQRLAGRPAGDSGGARGAARRAHRALGAGRGQRGRLSSPDARRGREAGSRSDADRSGDRPRRRRRRRRS